ncbi:hypothetical protein PRBEI_2001549800 [Prionailurus iriomotensis]
MIKAQMDMMSTDSVGQADQSLGGFNSLCHLGLRKFRQWMSWEGIIGVYPHPEPSVI